MRLSCLPVSFFSAITSGHMRVSEWAAMGASLGLDAIDLSILFVPGPSLAAAAELRRQIESEGMHVAMLTSYPDFTHPDAHQRSLELQLEQEVAAIAAELGAEMLRVTAGQAHPDTSIPAGTDWAAEGLAALADSVSNVTLVYENHAKPGAWQYTDFSQPPEIFLEIARRTAGTRLKINFDTGNAAAFSQDPVALLEQVLPRVASVHASDTAMHGALQHVLLGTGVTPYLEIFRCLRDSGWDRWICMEEASNLGKDGVRQAAEFVRRTWDAAGAQEKEEK
jgi:sugar phosphate isomerase/epimerase